MSVPSQESEQSCTVCVSGIDMCLYLYLARKVSQESEQLCTVCVSGIDMCLYLARKVSSHVQCVLVVSICVCT